MGTTKIPRLSALNGGNVRVKLETVVVVVPRTEKIERDDRENTPKTRRDNKI